jgi:hypothetical protein
MVLLFGCSMIKPLPQNITQSPLQTSPTPSLVIVPTTFIPYNTSSHTPTSPEEATTSFETDTPDPLRGAHLKFSCIDDIAPLPEDMVLTGTLVLKNSDIKETLLNNLATGITTQLKGENGSPVTDIKISPNHQWLAFRILESGKEWLKVISPNNIDQMRIPWGDGWSGIKMWVNNDTIVIYGVYDPLSKLRNIVLNPFTLEQREIIVDYPDFNDLTHPRAWQPLGPPIYNPMITQVVYPRIRGDENNHNLIVLWDIINAKVITFITSNPGNGPYGELPVWSPDGQQFVMSLYEFTKTTWAMELYQITKNGEINRLTYLTNYYSSNIEIPSYSWSPNQKYIAMWINSSQGSGPGVVELAILDIEKSQVTNYCIQSRYMKPMAPIWSPNGNWLVMLGWEKNSDEPKLINLEVENGSALKIMDGYYEPVGWLDSNP